MKPACNVGRLKNLRNIYFFIVQKLILWRLAPVSWDGLAQATNSFKAWWMEQGKAGKVQELQNRQEFTAYIMWHVWQSKECLVFKR